MSAKHRWWLISLVPLRLRGKTAERELGWLPMAKGEELMLSNLFYSFLLNKQSLWHVSSLTNTYHNSIFIWHNGPICFLLTYTTISLYSSNHWKLTGCCMCSFHYWGEDKDLGHLTSFPSWIWMNLIRSSVNTRCTIPWEPMLGGKIRNIGVSLMTFEKVRKFPKSLKKRKDLHISAE